MASRRIRLKGVLNIPTRRKAAEPAEKKREPSSTESSPKLSEKERNNLTIKDQSTENFERHERYDSKTTGSNTAKENPFVLAEYVCNDMVVEIVQIVDGQDIPCEQSSDVIVESETTEANATIDDVIQISDANIHKELEAPMSPTKINRARIKPAPRLGQRRISFNATESEDDSRNHYSRIRNDSVCSVTSTTEDKLPPPGSPAKKDTPNNIETPHLRKFPRRSDVYRKIIDAKLEFKEKLCDDGRPDKRKLTMMDLIFYNPSTNPMPIEAKDDNGRVQSDQFISANNEVDADEPSAEKIEEEADDDEEDVTIAPQIKLNADGEMIIDEKSLVIENKATIKGRLELQRARVVDGNRDTYGIYKRKQRSKEWSHAETLRFYKALNTIGTDFSMMCTLFPNRTRRELKMKFKREEKVNQALIDRAVLEPVQFDITELQEELAREEMYEKELEKQKLEASSEQEFTKHALLCKTQKTTEKRKVSAPEVQLRKKKPRLNSILNMLTSDEEEAGDEDSKDVEKDAESVCSRDGNDTASQCIEATEAEKDDDAEELDIEDLEPGSLMIVANKASGQNMVYMVTKDKKRVPVELSADILQSLTKNVQMLSENEETIDEQNYTIVEEVVDSVEEDTNGTIEELELNPSNNSDVVIGDGHVWSLYS